MLFQGGPREAKVAVLAFHGTIWTFGLAMLVEFVLLDISSARAGDYVVEILEVTFVRSLANELATKLTKNIIANAKRNMPIEGNDGNALFAKTSPSVDKSSCQKGREGEHEPVAALARLHLRRSGHVNHNRGTRRWQRSSTH